jgi:apolipoprotein N-acyltransferase
MRSIAIPALLAGLLFALSMPGPDLGLLAWVALVPLLWILDGRAPREAFKSGFLAGAAFFALLLHWLYTLWDWASFAIVPAYIILVGYLSLYWGVFGALFALMSRRLPLGVLIFVVPALWVGLEFLRSLTRFGFPWGQAADALYQQLPFVQISSLMGIWGVSFLVVLVNAGLALGFTRRVWHPPVVALGIAALAFSWGSWHLTQPQPEGHQLSLAILQPNIPQRIRGDPRRLEEFLDIYRKLLAEAEAKLAGSPSLMVLPESILPVGVLEDPEVLEEFSGWTGRNGIPLILGTYRYSSEQVFNSTVAISSWGEVLDTYDKVHLVPFSTEYFPAIELLKRLGLLRWIPVATRLGLLSKGEGFEPLSTELGPLATPICFESIFPHISREFVRRGAQIIITITNDAWFKASFALPQHFAKGVFRAVENGRYFIQAANTGISGIIDPQGRIVEKTRIEERTVLYGSAKLQYAQTFYTRFGDWLPLLSLFYLLGLNLRLLTRRGSHRWPRWP